MEAEHTKKKALWNPTEFEGNIKVTISEQEVRVWVCDEEGCRYRFKAIGKVTDTGQGVVIQSEPCNSHDALVEAGDELRDALVVVLQNIEGTLNLGPIMGQSILMAQESWDNVLALAKKG